MEREKERLKFCIDRYDHYYDSINNKSNVFLTLSIFIFGALAGVYPTVIEKITFNFWVHVLMVCSMAVCITIMIIVIRASKPYLTKEKDSLLYFHSVNRMGEAEFYRQSAAESEDNELRDLRKQTYYLACGLSKKFVKLKVVAMLFTLQFVLFIPLTYLIITHLKK